MTNPATVYSDLTGVITNNPRPTEADYRVARGQSVIDIVRNDLRTLQRLDMSRSDQHKVDAWLALLRETERGVCNADKIARVGITDAAVTAASSTDIATAFTLGGDMMMKLIALTMTCDVNRSILLLWPGFVTFNWDGISHVYDHQGLSNRTGTGKVGGPCVDVRAP